MKRTSHLKIYLFSLLILTGQGVVLAQMDATTMPPSETMMEVVSATKATIAPPIKAEAPSLFFEDFGTGYLENGTAHIYIDPNFSKNIIVDKDHMLKVFIQFEGACDGVYVTNATAEGFLVKELNNGISNSEFSWHIIANQKDEDNTNLVVSKLAKL